MMILEVMSNVGSTVVRGKNCSGCSTPGIPGSPSFHLTPCYHNLYIYLHRFPEEAGAGVDIALNIAECFRRMLALVSQRIKLLKNICECWRISVITVFLEDEEFPGSC